MRRFIVALLSATVLASCQQINSRERIYLDGEWSTELGIVKLPGTTDESQIGDTISNRTISGQLQRKHSFVGSLTYSANIEIPQSMSNKHIVLFMEKTKPSTLFIDGDSIGSFSHLHTPHIYDISNIGVGKHNIRIRIDNSSNAILPDIGGSHAVTEATQTNWNGIVGQFYIEAMPQTHIEAVQAYPDIDKQNILIQVVIQSDADAQVTLSAQAIGGKKVYDMPSVESQISQGFDTLSITLPMPNCLLWSAESPNLYTLNISMEANGQTDSQSIKVGMRKFDTQGTQFCINHQPTFLRGKHDACVFPLTGYAPTTVDEWLKVFRTAQAYGINHYRFHSWCPPEAAFAAADICGIYLQPELPYWGCLERDNNKLNTFLTTEGNLILNRFSNHPSFVMFALGNELCGDVSLMREWTDAFRQHDPRHLYAFGSNNNLGWLGQQEGEDFLVTCRIGGEMPGQYNTHVRASFSFADAADGGILNGIYPNTRMTYANAIKACTVPVVSHETCQFQIFPDFAETKKYTGVLEAVNYDVFRQRFEKVFGTTEQSQALAQAFHYASGRLSALCYKADIEMCLRTQGFGGFQMLDLQDYPGQGSALVGMLDAFMETKGIVSEDEFRGFCYKIVPLALMDKYTWTTNETFEADIQIANYSGNNSNEELQWQLSDGSQNIAQGVLSANTYNGTVDNIGHIAVSLSNVPAPAQLTLTLSNNQMHNTYHIWTYSTADSETLPYVSKIDQSIFERLTQGETILYIPQHDAIEEQSVGGLFTPDYWSYSMFKSISENIGKPVSPGTLGYCINTLSCNFADTLMHVFPSDIHSDWQWWIIAKNSRPLILDSAEVATEPAIWAIDNVDRSHKLSPLFEVPVGNGHLLVCTTDINAIVAKPEGEQYIKMLHKYISYYSQQPATANNTTLQQILNLFGKKTTERNIVGVKNLSDYKKVEK